MLDWISADAFVLNGTTFRTWDASPPTDLGDDQFFVFKPRDMVEQYVELIDALRPEHIFELGIYKGGSTAFLASLARAHKHVAVERAASATPLFDDWLRTTQDRVSAHFGVDQADTETLRRIVADEFGDAPLDLVIDDASHRLGPTRASFDVLFPRLRPGGLFVIEDWAAQLELDRLLRDDARARERLQRRLREVPEAIRDLEPPLTMLLFEIVLASVYTGVVDDLTIRRKWAIVRRGAEPVDADRFTISSCYSPRARDLLQGLTPQTPVPP